MPMEVAASSRQRAVTIADNAVPTPREVRMLVRAGELVTLGRRQS